MNHYGTMNRSTTRKKHNLVKDRELLQKLPGWYLLANLQQTHPGDRDQDVVIRVRGRRWGGILGQRVCPDCKAKKVK